jgi:hypothetical protein
MIREIKVEELESGVKKSCDANIFHIKVFDVNEEYVHAWLLV